MIKGHTRSLDYSSCWFPGNLRNLSNSVADIAQTILRDLHAKPDTPRLSQAMDPEPLKLTPMTIPVWLYSQYKP